jgi:tRNA nucleotidyltransferase (CCA-adding enzyme)
MPAITDETLAYWASSPSQTEQDKAERAERAIRNAIAASPTLSSRNVTAFAQGSYRNRTNVRAHSDVDVCVRCTDTYLYDLDAGQVITTVEPTFSPATYSFQ